MARVLVFGTFDTLHPGHLQMLTEASHYGEVTVSLTPDELCEEYKGRPAHHRFSERRARLLRLRCVHEVVPSDARSGAYRLLARLRPAVIVLGYDQRTLLPHIQKRLESERLGSKIVVLGPYRADIYHSSILAKMAS